MIDFIIALLLGIISGMGIGGGSILILYLTLVKDFPQLNAQSINLVYFIFCAIFAINSHLKNKLINFSVFLKCTFSGAITTIFASFLATSIETAILKRLFGVLLIYIGFSLVFAQKKTDS